MTRLARRGAAMVFLVSAAVIAGAADNPNPRGAVAPTYEVYAIRYATIPAFRLSGLIAGADTSRRLDIAMMVWLLKGSDGRKILVDAGFHRDDFVQRWHPNPFAAPSEA